MPRNPHRSGHRVHTAVLLAMALVLSACGRSADLTPEAAGPTTERTDPDLAARAEFERVRALEAGCCELHAEH